MSEGNKKERFGRYLILDHLVDGGMAKICRARFLGEQADKIVAIKMIQPQYSSDESFKTMFMDEIKVTFGLLHPNIVQTYDYGLQKDQLFVAMEYCDGRNLKEYLDRLRQKKFVFPVEISVYIISQVCQGLHYSHTLTDKLSGKAAHIIHRDISPHNIMLTYDGSVKIIDFGIAKANTNSEATQAGTIKGKLSYLAPEYLDGLNLDARYDMFAVGITLWEMLCSRKLFKAANDLAVLKKIQECKIPAPSKINPNVPKELDDIVLKALHKDRNKRFENMDQLNRALIKFLYANYPDFNSSDLSYFAKELFKEEIKKDRERLFEFGKINIKPYLNDWKAEQEGRQIISDPVSSDEKADPSKSKQRRQEQVLDFGFEEDSNNTATSLRRKKDNAKEAATENQSVESDELKVEPVAPKKKKAAVNTNVPGLPGIPANESNTKSGKTKSRVRKNSSTRTRSETSTISVQRENESRGSVIKYAIVASIVAAIVHFGRNDIPFVKNIIGDREPASEVSKTPVEPLDNVVNQLNGGIRIENYDSQLHRVYVNGKRVKPDFLKKIKVPAEKEVILRVERPGFKHFVKRIKVSGEDSRSIKLPQMSQESFGYLYLSRGCKMYGEISFELYGEKRVENIPFRSRIGIPFPVNGDGRHPANSEGHAEYTVFYQNNTENVQRKITFSFSRDEQRVDLCGK